MTELETELTQIWCEVLGISQVGLHDEFLKVGGNPTLGAALCSRIETKYGHSMHIPWLLAAPTVAKQAAWLEMNRNPGAVAPVNVQSWRDHWRKVFAQEAEPSQAPKNPQAAFIISPGRSGSTLLRIMLAGHPQLFVPPEMELLIFRDMQNRWTGLRQGWFDFFGLERAVMELWHCDADTATKMVADWRDRNLHIQEVYRLLQGQLKPSQMLVDKSPSYAIAPGGLKRAEVWFENPLYIHLTRHPLASIRSWVASNFDQVLHAPPTHAAEMSWLVMHENILKHLATVPANRQIRVRFEELVKQPEEHSRKLCDFLGVPYDPAVLDPYAHGRMAEFVNGKVAGDRNFYKRKKLDPSAADGSKRMPGDIQLQPDTLKVAEALGYEDV